MKRFLFGLRYGLSGLLAKEFRSRSRGWRPLLVLTGFLGALALGGGGFLWLITRSGEPMRPGVGVQFFSILATGFVVLLALVTPALTAGSISGERERKTLDLLLITQASPLGLIAGKWLGSVLYVLYLLIASLPALTLVYLFGGVQPARVGMVVAVAAVTALTYSALGLLCSALFKRTGVASLVSYLLVFLLLFGMPFIAMIQQSGAGSPEMMMKYGMSGGAVARTPAYSSVSPLTAVASVLPQPSANYGGGILQELFQRVLRVGYSAAPTMPTASPARVKVMTRIDPKTGTPEYAETWAPWVIYFGLSGAMALLALLLSAAAISPLPLWRVWRVQLRNRRTGVRLQA